MQQACQQDCQWGAFTACQGPGTVTTGPCADCGSQTVSCDTNGVMTQSACQGTGVISDITCGKCGHQSVLCGPDGVHVPQTGCEGEGACAAGTQETRACCDCGTQARVCDGACQWGGWGACEGPDPADGTLPCSTGIGGPCDPGLRRCVQGCLSCVAVFPGEPETCDGVDNDCDKAVDDGSPQAMGATPPPLAAALVDYGAPQTLGPGDSAQAWAAFRNVGSETWPAGGVWLETDGDAHVSPLWDQATWPAFHVAAVAPAAVAPGEHAVFTFRVRLAGPGNAPATETFRLASSSGQKLMCPNPIVTLTIRPGPAGAVPPEPPASTDRAGCACRTAADSQRSAAAGILVALGLAAGLLARRRRLAAPPARW